MRTNSRLFLQKGYSRLAFTLLILAMCFIAFVVVPFSNTQAKAYEYNKNDFIFSTANSGNYAQTLTYNNKGAIFFGNDDASGIAAVNASGFPDQDPVQNNRDKSPQNLQFAPKYYDLSKIEKDSTNLLNSLSVESFAKGQNMIQTVELKNMSKYFGVGSGHIGFNAEKNGVIINTTYSDTSIKYTAKGWTISDGKNDQDRTRAWRVDNGYMYTYIKVPEALAPYLTVSAEAEVKTQDVVRISENGDSKYNYRYIPVMDMQVGNKDFEDGETSNVLPSNFKPKEKDGKAIAIGDGTDSKTDTVRKTAEVKMAGSQWIKLAFGVMTTDGPIWTYTLAGGIQDWFNLLQVSNVKLNFKLTQPVFEDAVTIDNPDGYTSGNKVVSFEIAALISKKQDDSYDLSTEVDSERNLFRSYEVKVFDVLNGEDTLIEISYQPKKILANLNKVVFHGSTTFDTNGRYKIVIYDKFKTNEYNEKMIVAQTEEFSIRYIDKDAPEMPVIDLKGGWVTNDWISDKSENGFKLSNIVDNLSPDNVGEDSEPALASIELSLIYLKDTIYDDLTAINIDELISNAATEDKSIKSITHNTGDSKIIKLTEIKSDFYTSRRYGNYALVYSVKDKAKNECEKQIVQFKYDHNAIYKIKDIEIKVIDGWKPVTEFFNNNWLNKSNLIKESNFDIRFNLNDDKFFFPMIANLYNPISESEEPIATFNKVTSITSDNLGYYVANVNITKLLGQDKNFNNQVQIIGGSETKQNELYNFELKIDTINPFMNNNESYLDFLVAGSEELPINGNIWYTFRNNEFFIQQYSDYTIKAYENGGLYVLVYADNENNLAYNPNDNILSKYKFYLNDNPVPLSEVNLVGDVFGLYIPLNEIPATDGIYENIKIKVVDQANNSVEKIIPCIKYDDRKYNVKNIEVSHLLKEEYGENISFWVAEPKFVIDEAITDENLERIATRLTVDDLNDIAYISDQFNFRRGTRFIIRIDANELNSQNLEIDGLSIANNCEIETYQNKKLYVFTFGGSTEDDVTITPDITEFDINIYLYKNIMIDVYCGPTILDQTDVNIIPYDGSDIQFKIYEKGTKKLINDGIVSYGYYEDGKWVNIKNHVENAEIAIGIKNEKERVKTRKDVVIRVTIPKVNAAINISQDSILSENVSLEGNQVIITQPYGQDVNLDLSYELTNFDKFSGISPDMIYVVESNGYYKPINRQNAGKKYDVLFIQNPNNLDNFVHNYNFKLMYDGKEVSLVVNVVPREIEVDITNKNGGLIEYIYGGNEYGSFDTDKLQYTMNLTDKDKLELDSKFGNEKIVGDVILIDKNDNNHRITRTSPVNDVNDKRYGFNVDELYVNNYEGNIKLVINKQNEPSFNIVKRDVTFELNSRYSTMPYGKYDNKFTFIDPNKSELSGVVLEDKNGIDLIYQNIKLESLKTQHYDINFDENGLILNSFLNADNYTATFVVNSNAIKNYNVTVKPFSFEITKKEIYIDLDINKSILSKFWTDGLSLDEVSIKGLLKANYNKLDIQDQFVTASDVDDYKYVDDSGELIQAFTIKRKGGISDAPITDVGVYDIIPTASYIAVTHVSGNDNYVFIARTEMKFSIYTIEEGKIMLDFTKTYWDKTYGYFRTPEILQQFIAEEIMKETDKSTDESVKFVYFKFRNDKGVEVDVARAVANKIAIAFADQQGSLKDLTTANAGKYNVKIEFNAVEGETNPFIVDTNAIVEIKQLNLYVKFDPTYDKFNGINTMTIPYGTVFDESNKDLQYEYLNGMLKVYSDADYTKLITDVSNGRLIKGSFKLVVEGTPKYYNAGKYNIDLSDIWFTASNQNNNYGNYKLNLPLSIEIEKYHVVVTKRVITKDDITFVYDGKAPAIEYGQKLELNNFTYNVNDIVLAEDKNVLGIIISSFTYDTKANAGDDCYVFFKCTITNPNYEIETNVDGYVAARTKLVINKRKVFVDYINYYEKNFDNTNVVNTDYLIKIVGDLYIDGNKTNFDNLYAVEAHYKNANVKNNSLVFNISIINANPRNFEFVTSDTVINQDNPVVGYSFEPTSNGIKLVNVPVLINPLKLVINSNITQEVLNKEYNGNDDVNLKNLTYTLTTLDNVKVDFNTKDSNISINDITHLAKYANNRIDNGTNLPIIYNIHIDSNIYDINNNFKIYLNSESQLIKVGGLDTIYDFSKTLDETGNISKNVIKLTDESLVTKTYDKKNTINTANDAEFVGDKNFITEGNYVFSDGSSLVIYPNVFGKDKVILKFDLSSIKFKNVNAGEQIDIAVDAELVAGSNMNYILSESTGNGKGKVYINGLINQKEVTFKVNNLTQTNITKAYDGTDIANIEQFQIDEGLVGLIEGDEAFVGLKVVGGAHYDNPYFGDNKFIQIKDAKLIDKKPDKRVALNYKLKNDGAIEGIRGSITPRPVNIDASETIVYTTRYNGSNGTDYKVVIVDKIPTAEQLSMPGIVYVYMKFVVDDKLKGNGILSSDLKYQLMPSIQMQLDNKLSTPEQPIQLVEGSTATIVTSAVRPDANIDIISKSYKIANLNDIFPDGNLPTKIIIQKYKITNQNIFFEDNDSFNKIYDGTTALDERVKAKVVNDKDNYAPSFLDNDIQEIRIANKDNVYNDPNVTTTPQHINIKLTNEIVFKDILKSVWYEFDDSFDYLLTNIESRIVARNVHVKIVAKNKKYDSTNIAILNENYELVVDNTMTDSLEGLMKIHLGKIVPKPEVEKLGTNYLRNSVRYASDDVTADNQSTSMIFGNLVMKYVDTGAICNNYVVVVDADPTNLTVNENQEYVYNNLKITKADLEIKTKGIEFEYGSSWDKVISAYTKEDLVKFIGLKGNDMTDDSEVVSFINSLNVLYMLDENTAINGTDVLDANVYRKAIKVKTNLTLSNYNIIYNFGTITVYPKNIVVTSNDTTINFGEGITSNEIKNNMNFFEVVVKDNVPENTLITDVNRINILKSFINVAFLPDKMSDTGTYNLSVDLIKGEGSNNYNIKLEGNKAHDGNFVCVINSIEIPVDKNVNVDNIKLMPGLDIIRIITNYANVYIDESNFIKINLSVLDENNNALTNESITDFTKGNIMVDEGGNSYKVCEGYKILVTASGYKGANYKDTYINIGKFNISQERMDIEVGDYTVIYDKDKTFDYPANEKIAVSSRYKDYVKYVVFNDKNVWMMDETTGKHSVKDVGKYFVVIYSTDSAYKINKPDNASSIMNRLANYSNEQFYIDANNNGFVVANMSIIKKTVNNIGLSSISFDESVASAKTVLDKIKTLVKINNPAITNDMIVFDVNPTSKIFSKAGVYSVRMSLPESIDKEYTLKNPVITVIINTKSLADEENSIIIQNVTNTNINTNIINSGISYKKATAQDRDSVITENVQQVLGKPYFMAYVQLNNPTIELSEQMNVKVKVNSKYIDKNLYLVDDNGFCNKIDDVSYEVIDGETYAVFNTNKLGWFVQADGPQNPVSDGVIAAVSILGIALSILIIMLVVVTIQANKIRKLKK